MIRYTLKCDNNHSFDSWFQSVEAFDKLTGTHMIACAVCGSSDVVKAIMAPRVRPARNASAPASETAPDKEPSPLSQPASAAEQALVDLRRKIEANSENVGPDFAREARAIHDGDAPMRPIIGEAKPDEAKSLIEDGIPVSPLPWSSRRSN